MRIMVCLGIIMINFAVQLQKKSQQLNAALYPKMITKAQATMSPKALVSKIHVLRSYFLAFFY